MDDAGRLRATTNVVVDLAFWLPLRPPGKAGLKAGVSAIGTKVPVALMAQAAVVLPAAAGAAVWLVEDAARSV